MGEYRTMGPASPAKQLFDNGVPGPGMYHSVNQDGIPSFKICNETELNDK